MIATYNTVFGICEGSVAHAGLTSWPSCDMISRARRVFINLTYGAAKGICKRCYGSSGDSASLSEPQITIARGSCKNEWLCKSNEDLGEHNDAEVVCSGAAIFDPIANEDKDGGDDNGWFWPIVQDPECEAITSQSRHSCKGCFQESVGDWNR